MSSLSEALRQVRLPDERNQELLVAAADALDRAEAASVRDHQNTMHMIQSLTDLFREEKAAWQVERAAHDKAMGEVIRERNEARAMLDRQQRAGDAVRDALWTLTEHNALHFGEQHSTVIQGRAALSAPQADGIRRPLPYIDPSQEPPK